LQQKNAAGVRGMTIEGDDGLSPDARQWGKVVSCAAEPSLQPDWFDSVYHSVKLFN